MQITTEQIKELRDQTGISVMQCKKALEEGGGDMKKALAILKNKSSSIAEKKLSREVKDGRVEIKADLKRAIIIPLHCETDFVARNADFVNLLEALSEKAWEEGVDKMKTEAKEMIDPVVQKTGENIQLGTVEEVKGDVLGTYVHGNKIGVIVSLSGGNAELARDIAMHVAAMKPEYISRENITAEAKKTMEEVFRKEIAGVNKPEEIKNKMLEGKMASYFKEQTLLDQPYIKDGDVSVGQLLEKANAKILEVKRYSI